MSIEFEERSDHLEQPSSTLVNKNAQGTSYQEIVSFIELSSSFKLKLKFSIKQPPSPYRSISCPSQWNLDSDP